MGSLSGEAKAPTFTTEAELCAAFAEWVLPQGWAVYPETAGWDLLLVAPSGHQLGVQAKLRLNAKVLKQAAPDLPSFSRWGEDRGPDFRAILVPELSDLAEIATMIGFSIILPTRDSLRRTDGFVCRTGVYDTIFTHQKSINDWVLTDWNPTTRESLPDYVPDVAAGVASPTTLSPWKVAALRVLATIEVHGEITRKQVEAFGINSRRWCSADAWLKPGTERGRWIRGSCPDFEKQHPGVYAAIVDEMRAAGLPHRSVGHEAGKIRPVQTKGNAP